MSTASNSTRNSNRTQNGVPAQTKNSLVAAKPRDTSSGAYNSPNPLDETKLVNLPPISTRNQSEFPKAGTPISEHLLNGKKIAQYAANDTCPIPGPANRKGYFCGNDGNYWMSGLDDFLKINNTARKYKLRVKRYFDFGCATGRVLRHFAAQSDVDEIWGTDTNRRYIRWITENLPLQIKPVCNNEIPSLPMEDNYFDVVSAFSVFTHNDICETAWISGLRRVLKPGGIAYLTVHNEDTWQILRDDLDNPKYRLIKSMLKADPQFAENVQRPLENERTVYRYQENGTGTVRVFHSNDYLHRTWGRFMDVKEILPRRHNRQTVVVLQK